MSRVQLALRVADLEGSVAFYSRLFGAEPAKRRPGYANFAIAEPPLKLVLIEGAPGEPTRMDHLGVEVETTGEVTAAAARLAAAGLRHRHRGGHRLLLRRPGQGLGHRPRRRAVGGLRRQGRRRRPRQGRRLRLLRPGRQHDGGRVSQPPRAAADRRARVSCRHAVTASRASAPWDCRRYAVLDANSPVHTGSRRQPEEFRRRSGQSGSTVCRGVGLAGYAGPAEPVAAGEGLAAARAPVLVPALAPAPDWIARTRR